MPRPPEVVSAAADASSAFGRYVKVAPLGRGGGGEVWKAYDPTLSRWIALKLLHGTSEEEIARFVREAQTAAQLSHPNIAAIFEVGREGGRHYIAMQFVEGTTLRHAGLDARGAARCVRDAARAVAHAHSKGIVHRDLKPDNVMISKEHVFVMDFGLARAVEGGTKVSVTGTVVGTPAYMPPEQARAGKVDGRSDVYSLGATLYELIAGRPPFDGPTIFAVLKKVEEEEPARIARADRDLETIAMKCLEKDPGRRYETATELAGDLDRWLAGEPIHAHPPSLAYRARKGLARRKAAVAVIVLVVAVAGLAAALTLPDYLKGRRTAELWKEVSPILAQAEAAARARDLPLARTRAVAGSERCRARPELAQAHFFLGRLFAVTGDPAAAIEAMDRAKLLDPAFKEARLSSGVLRAERYLAALRELKMREDNLAVAESQRPDLQALRGRAVAALDGEIGPSDYVGAADQAYARGLLAHARGQFGDAQQAFEQSLREDPVHVGSMMALARLARDQGRLEDASRRVERVIEVHRGLAEAFRLRGSLRLRTLTTTGRGFEEAAADADRAVALDPASAENRSLRAMVQNAGGNLERALADLDEAVRLAPDRFDLLGNRAIARDARAIQLANAGRTQEATAMVEGAMSDLDGALRLNPAFEAARVNRAVARYRRGDLAGALEDFDAAIAANGACGSAYLNRAMIRYDRGEFEKALADAGEAVRLLSTSQSHANRGLVRNATGDTEGALADAEEALRLFPKNASALVLRAVYHGNHGDPAAALKDLTDAIDADAGYVPAYSNRARLHQASGRRQEALRDYEAIIRLAPLDSSGYVGRAFCRRDAGDTAGAVEDFQKATQVNPREFVAFANLGAIRLAQGDKAAAAIDLKKALGIAPANWAQRQFAEELLRKAEAD